MSTYLDALLAGQSKARSLATNEDAVDVDVAESAPPNAGDVLVAVDSTHATWQPPGGGTGGTASGLETSGAPVDVASAAPPVAGQVLTAVDAEHAEWRVPGLHYDPSIKFWTSSVGSATILPNSWGFIQQPPEGTAPVVVYIVSSLEAPPVDSRFGLYVWREMTVPVTVNVLGDSQIQGLDGVLGTSTVLLPGADYEWVFYHEDGFAIWGLVSDTAGVAKRLVTDGGLVELGDSAPPNPGDVLTAVDSEHAEWLPPSGGGGLTFIGSSGAPSAGQWCLVDSGITSVTMPSDAVADDTIGMFVATGQDGTLLHLPSGFELAFGNKIADPSAPLKLRGGGYYEWTLQPYGETSGRWLPRGMSNESPAPLASRGFGTIYPNEWVLSSDYSDVVNAPSAPQLGDCLAIYVNSASASVVPASGQSIVSPDGTTVISSPSALTLPGNTYYEWIWVASASHWKPKNYLDAPGNGLIRSGKTLAVGANADASIVVNADDIRVGVLATDAQHGARGGGTTHAVAGSGSAGFMSTGHFDKVSALSYAYKEPVRAVATTNNTLSGAQTVDGILIGSNERMLCTAQTTASQNGIWLWSGTSWSRPTDANLSSHWPAGALVIVTEGTTYADTLWMLTTDSPISLGSTSLSFTQQSGARGVSGVSSVLPTNNASIGTSNRWAPVDHVHKFTAVEPAANNFRVSNNATGSIPTWPTTTSTVWAVPHTGTRIGLYNSTIADWITVDTPSIPSIAITGQIAGIPCDIFAVYSTTTAFTLELAPWTSATLRTTAIVQQNGVWTKSGSPNKRYLGTILPDSATTYTHTTAPASGKAICGIWNQNNRIKTTFQWTAPAGTATPGTAGVWAALPGMGVPHVELMYGQGNDSYDVHAVATVGNSPNPTLSAIGITLDLTSTVQGHRSMVSGVASGAFATLTARASAKPVGVGVKYASMLAQVSVLGPTFLGVQDLAASGLSVDFWH